MKTANKSRMNDLCLCVCDWLLLVSDTVGVMRCDGGDNEEDVQNAMLRKRAKRLLTSASE